MLTGDENSSVVGIGRLRPVFMSCVYMLCRIAVRECGSPRAGRVRVLAGPVSWVRPAGPPRHPRTPMAAVACGWPRDRDKLKSVAIVALLHALCACVHRM